MLKHLRQLAGESLVYGLAGIISRFLSVFLVPIYTRIFTPEDYGVMSLVTTTMAVVAIFVVLALDNSAHRWYWDTEDIDDRKRTLASWAWCQLALSSLVAFGIFVAAGQLADLLVGRADAGLYFQLSALALPLGVLNAVTVNWLRMQRRPWATTVYALGTNLLTILLTLLLVVVFNWGLAGIYAASALSGVASTAVGAWLMRDWIAPWRFHSERLRAMLRFGLPLIPASLALWVVGFADRYFVQFYTNTSEVGLYQVGNAIAMFVALLTGAFQQAWGPFAMSIHKRADAKQVYANVFLAYICLTSMLATTLALLAPEAIRLIATEQYLGASPVVGILAFSYVMIGLGYIASIGPSLVKQTGPTGLAITVAAVLNIVLNVVLVPYMGKIGSALATLLAQAVVPIYLFYRSQSMYPIPYRFKTAAAIFLLAFALAGLGSSIQISNVWIGIAAKLALISLFIPASFILRIVTLAQARSLLRVTTH